ncbi:DDT domain-containing protein PTM-like [Apium graveolens]|uniref:DDT domain-containing protein PTM-like n=1 Tax=Apium graveolens TaxID=4045 RepID=UPI003D7989CC
MEPEVVRVERRGRKRKRRDVENVVEGGMRRETRSKAMVGSYVNKEFEGSVYLGKVVNYDRGFYRIEYEDGDSEDLTSGELRQFLIRNEGLDEGFVVRKKQLDDLITRKNEEMEREKEREAREMMNVDVVEGAGNGRNSVLADGDCLSDSGDDAVDGDLGIEAEVCVVPPPELPPSTGNIGVPDECVANLLSIYSFLRSFSCALFLSPFGLDDFVGSLNCSIQNTLLDAIHVALMRVIQRHFEDLLLDGSELASKCLRSMDWSLIDSLTWPVFTVQYIMMMGYTGGLEWQGFYIDALQRDYYSLSVSKKLMILQILCDDALDSSELRAEIDMLEEAEVKDEMDHDRVIYATQSGPRRVHPRYSKTSACKDLQATAVFKDNYETKSSTNTNSFGYMNTRLNNGTDVDQDANSDECRLCGMEGTLLCCDGCPSAYHSRCIGVMKMFIPEGDWYCPECTINKIGPTITRETSLKGADFFGVDPYEQVFMGTCDHLLVIKGSTNSEQPVRYYHKEDLSVVLKVLSLSAQHHDMYSGLCKKIVQYWDIPVSKTGSNSAKTEDGAFPTEELSLLSNSSNVVSRLSVGENTPICNAESSFGNIVGPLLENTTKNIGKSCFYTGASFKPQSYLNHYAHGDFAAAAASNLSVLSSEENHVALSNASTNHRKVVSANISLQTKAFSSAAIRFFWPDVEKKLMEVPRERCGWCISCQATCHSKRGCLLNAAASNAIKGTMKILAAIRPVKHGEGSLHSIATYLIFMEESLHGLTVGPFKTSGHRKKWCEQAEQASTCRDLKTLLLELEENIHYIALSGDWVKIVDDSLAEPSATHGTSAAVSTQKRGPGRRGRKPSAMPEVTADEDQDISDAFVWWRGGMLSKVLFHKGILPHIVVKNSARQGGSRKIMGIYYAEGVDVPKRSRRSIWRVAVEMSRNSSQLASQIRYLDMHVRWGDLVRPEQSSLDGKGAETEAYVFRNASICDKQVLESKIRYAVAFGNQKHLPSRIMKNVCEVEKVEGGREKYWFLETRVPLYLIKEYEEKMDKVSPPLSKKPTNVLSTLQRQQLKVSRKDIFSYLVRKRDNLDCCRCASCQLDVFLGNAVKCSTCEGYCHFQCTVTSTVHMKADAEFVITCKSCYQTEASMHGEKYSVAPTVPLVPQGQKPLTAATAAIGEKSNGFNQPIISNGGSKRSIERKPRPSVSSEPHNSEHELGSASASKPKKKSKACSLGLIWSKNGEDGTAFRLKNVLLKGNSNFLEVECDICRNPYNPDLMYIFCETCTKWYHADAVELEESKLFKLTGFKCCKCRRIKSPSCPYTDPERKTALESKKPNKRTPKQRQGTDFCPQTVPEQLTQKETASTVLPIKNELVCVKVDNPLTFSLSRVDHGTQNISSVALEQNPTLSGSVPQKLPVRRHMKREEESYEVASNVSADSFTPLAGNSFVPTDESPPGLKWDVSSNIEDQVVFNSDGLNYEEMEFEPQTYFSFNELLPDDDGAYLDPSGNMIKDIDQLDAVDQSGNLIENIDNSSMIPAEVNVEPYEMTVEQQDHMNIYSFESFQVACQICCYTDPVPDRCCQVCGVWMHSYCTGWVEESSNNGAWRCGNCQGQ